MPGRTQFDEARRAWERTRRELGDELRAARMARGLSQAEVAAAIGTSQAEMSRREVGRTDGARGAALAVHAAAVGLQLVMRCHPAGDGLRDAGQLRWIRAFAARVGSGWRIALEVPVPIAGDRRAVDMMLTAGNARIAVEVVTRLTDVQAQLRRARLKARDIGATRLILVIAGSARNRRAVAAARGSLVASFMLDARSVLAELAAGRDPGIDASSCCRIHGTGHLVIAIAT